MSEEVPHYLNPSQGLDLNRGVQKLLAKERKIGPYGSPGGRPDDDPPFSLPLDEERSARSERPARRGLDLKGAEQGGKLEGIRGITKALRISPPHSSETSCGNDTGRVSLGCGIIGLRTKSGIKPPGELHRGKAPIGLMLLSRLPLARAPKALRILAEVFPERRHSGGDQHHRSGRDGSPA